VNCGEICAPESDPNLVWIGSWIASCISPQSEPQYQCEDVQYHVPDCIESDEGDGDNAEDATAQASGISPEQAPEMITEQLPTITLAPQTAPGAATSASTRTAVALPVVDAGWELVRASPAPERARGNVNAAVATVETTAPVSSPVATQKPQPPHVTRRAHGRQAVKHAIAVRKVATPPAPPLAAAHEPSASDDWFLRSLLLLLVAALLALLATMLSHVQVAGAAVTALRSRLASKGLSATRVSRRGGRGIRYRD
jgi:hypothetical protein